MLATALEIPIIDLAGTFSSDAGDRMSVARAVRSASERLGLFAVTNHGVPASLIASQLDLARAFFALDEIEKRAIDVRTSNCFRGYEPFATQTIDAAAPGDLKEGFIMGPDLPPDHPHVIAGYPNTGTNRWPRRPADFRDRMEAYVAAMNGLGRGLAGALALSLELPETFFAPGLAQPLTYSQLLHYPAVDASAFQRHLGAGAHVDWGMLTILLQDDVGGLEVRADDGTWHPVLPIPGALLIILGELMVRWTGGRYRSAVHRVAKNVSGRSRYSMPTFIDPSYDEWVACVPTCLPMHGEAPYAACTVADHMRAMARERLSL
jgi:isopenicillin N synthase-like dioxygenase